MSSDPADAESPLLPSPNDEGESSAAVASAGKDASSAIESAATKMAQTTYWLLSNIGASGFLGICAGVATKTIGRWLALLIGLVFVLMQVLAYYGVVTVHWEDMRKKAMSVLDANKDGRVDYEDAKLVWKKAFSLMGQGLPSVAGFLGGFFLGLKFF